MIFACGGGSTSSQVLFGTKALYSSVKASLHSGCKQALINCLGAFSKGILCLEWLVLARVSIWCTLEVAGGKTMLIEGLCSIGEKEPGEETRGDTEELFGIDWQN